MGLMSGNVGKEVFQVLTREAKEDSHGVNRIRHISHLRLYADSCSEYYITT